MIYYQVGKYRALPFFPRQRFFVYQLRVGHFLCMVVNPTGRHNCREADMAGQVLGGTAVIRGQGWDGETKREACQHILDPRGKALLLIIAKVCLSREMMLLQRLHPQTGLS